MTEPQAALLADHGWSCTCGHCPDPEAQEAAKAKARAWHARWGALPWPYDLLGCECDESPCICGTSQRKARLPEADRG